MRVSIVTISFNQGEFLKECIDSVVDQDYEDLEYIVVDPGSTDGSRELIQSYGNAITKKILEPDDGPVDGLNKGFAHATGDIYGFINADDKLLQGTLKKIVQYFASHSQVDVVSGHGYMIDAYGNRTRRFFSDRFSLLRYAYGPCGLFQQGTFFTADIFWKVGGFNPGDGICWDGELWTDMALHGARFNVINAYLAEHRIHPRALVGRQKESKVQEMNKRFRQRMFRKIMGRNRKKVDELLRVLFLFQKYIERPTALYERLTKGNIFSAKA